MQQSGQGGDFMISEEKRRVFLTAVQMFGKSGRYHGMMPRWVVDSCSQQEVRDAFLSGCVAYSTIDGAEGPAIEGMILTEKGLKLLEAS